MDKKPHSREKKIESGSADLNRGQRVDTGSRPVGNGGRGENPGPGRSTPQRPADPRRPAQRSVSRASGSAGGGLPFKLNPKTILIIAAVLIVLLIIIKACGGFSGFPEDFPTGGNIDIGNDTSAGGYEDFRDGILDRSVSPLARSKYVTPAAGDKVTVMVYMCGTDLESKYGMASADLREMASADLSDDVNLIVMTGGCSGWKTSGISSSCNQIYRVRKNKLELVKENAGDSAMTDYLNLASFIDFCEEKYPAERNILIFWDHGGGSVTGYGYDEKQKNPTSMTLSQISAGLAKANCRFDVIGFDACLMATLETALVCEPYADYLIASEESEPGTGWYYTRWLSELSADSAKPTLDVAKILIDDFVTASSQESRSAMVTLSLVDLAELHGTVPSAFTGFASSTNELIRSDFTKVSNARAGVRQFAQSSKINQVDLVDLANRIGTPEAAALASTLKGCVKYNRSTITRSYGISVYFPYENTSTVKAAVASYDALGLDDEYAECIKSFASLELGGQVTAAASQVKPSSSSSGDLLGALLSGLAGGGSSTSPLDVLAGTFLSGSGQTASAGFGVDASSILSLLGAFSGRSMPTELSWVDTDLIAVSAEKISKNYLDASRITATPKGSGNVLALSDAEWALIQTVELNVFAKDGDGTIDLGLDNVAEYDADGDLILGFDGTWLTLDDNVCAYYLVSDTEQEDGSYITVGRIPAILNDINVNLQVVFDKDHPYGTVTGAYPMYADSAVQVEAKGLIRLNTGDSITLLCDCYHADGSYDAAYTLGSEFKVTSAGLHLANQTVNAEGFSVTYRLTDIYGNHYWTPAFNQ